MRSVLVAAACAVALSPAAVAQQAPIKIGFISTFSGPSGQLGQELLDGKGRPPRAFVPQAAPSWSTCLCHLAGWEGPPLKIQRKYSGGGAPEQSNWVRSDCWRSLVSNFIQTPSVNERILPESSHQ